MKKRVVITGIGMMTPLGNDVKSTWENLKNGKSGIDYFTKVPDVDQLPVKFGGEIKGFEPEKYFNRRELKQYDIFTQYALVASDEAIKMSGIKDANFDSKRVGVILSTGIGGIHSLLGNYKNFLTKGPRDISIYLIPKMISNIAAGIICMRNGFHGVSYSIVSACASSAHGVGEAFRKIQYGELDVAIAGGSEAPLVDIAIIGFNNLRAISKRNDDPSTASRPFDKTRDGFIMAEGVGIVVLEEYEHAKKRGADILGEMIGYGASSDAYHLTASHPDGLGAATCMENAIKDAGITPEKIKYVNAHGTSTPVGDISETKAIKKVFKDHAKNLFVSSTKSMIGHTLGAAGAVEFISTLLTVKEDVITPTINYSEPDPECDLNYVPNNSIEEKVEYALSNSFGFGGQNASCIVKKI